MHMQDAASWLFPSTEASRAASQAVPKSKQLVQRFNQAFRRTKATKSADQPAGAPQPEAVTQTVVSIAGRQQRAGSQSEAELQPGAPHPEAISQKADSRQWTAGAQSKAELQLDTARLRQSSELKPAEVQGSLGAQGSTGVLHRAGQVQNALQADLTTSVGAAPRAGLLLPKDTADTSPALFPEQTIGFTTPSQQMQAYPQPQLSPSQQGSSRVPMQQSPFSQNAVQALSRSSSSVMARNQLQGSSAMPHEAMHAVRPKGSAQYSPDPDFELLPSADNASRLLPYPQGRALHRQKSSPQARAEGNSPVAWSSSPVLKAVPTPDKEEQRASTVRRASASHPPRVLEYEAAPGQQEDDYIPGMYDGLGTASSAISQRLPEQQQQQPSQQAWYQQQSQQQQPQQLQPQQLQQQLSGGTSRDYMVDMHTLSIASASNKQALFEAQRAQRRQGSLDRSSTNPGQADSFPELAQQVPFYESSPQYMPTTVAANLPILSEVTSLFTGFLPTPKRPADIETGANPASNSPTLARQPTEAQQPAGCSPKMALLKSGLFQHPRGADQDRPMSPEQTERRARGLVRTRVEPKVFFANERTFLQWLQISVLLMFTGLSLLGGSSLSSMGGSSNASASCASDNTACKASKV